MNIIIEQSKEKTKLPGVMRAALKLFVKGIDGTTIKDIARRRKSPKARSIATSKVRMIWRGISSARTWTRSPKS